MYENVRRYEDQTTAVRQGPLDEIDHELERFDVQLERLTKILSPVINQYANEKVAMSEPRPEPATALRGRTDRLRDRLNRLDLIMSEIDL